MLGTLQLVLFAATAQRDLDTRGQSGAECSLDGVDVPGCTFVRTNPLKGLKPLPKVHYSWPFPPQYLNTSDPAFLDGLMLDYVRISGGCALGVSTIQPIPVSTCVKLCMASNTARSAANLPKATITLNYSPWYEKFPGNDPTLTGAAEVAELAFYRDQLTTLQKLISAADGDGVGLGAVLLDSEKFHFIDNSSKIFKDALTRKHNLIWNVTQEVFPGVRVEMYDRGATEKWDTSANWSTVPLYTLQESGTSYGVSLYTIPEIWNMRGRYQHTVALAQNNNATSTFPSTITSVTPWLALGCGYMRTPKPDGLIFSFTWDYDMVYSWQLGMEINNPWYGSVENQGRYAPWRYATAVAFYPSSFDLRSVPAGPGYQSTAMMQHFATYVMGATGVNALAPEL